MTAFTRQVITEEPAKLGWPLNCRSFPAIVRVMSKRPVRADAAAIVRQIDAELERVAGRVAIAEVPEDEVVDDEDLGIWDDDVAEVVERGHRSFSPGDLVMIEWDGAWYDGKVVAIRGNKYRVTYDGWEASWNEEVPAARLRMLVTARPKQRRKPKSPKSRSAPKPKKPRKPKRR
jgi:agenet domain-containing protein